PGRAGRHDPGTALRHGAARAPGCQSYARALGRAFRVAGAAVQRAPGNSRRTHAGTDSSGPWPEPERAGGWLDGAAGGSRQARLIFSSADRCREQPGARPRSPLAMRGYRCRRARPDAAPRIRLWVAAARGNTPARSEWRWRYAAPAPTPC